MIKLSKATDSELKCLCGLCKHDMFNKSCAWNQMLDKADPDKELYNRVVKLIKTEITAQNKKNDTKTKSKRK